MIPPQAEIEVPLLEALVQLGGQAKPKDVYPIVTAKFPQVTPEDMEARLQHGERLWHNRIQWVRQRLIESGDVDSPQRGIWAITEQGKKRVEANGTATPAVQRLHAAPTNLVELYLTRFALELLRSPGSWESEATEVPIGV